MAPKTKILRAPEELKAFSSPVRLEILGLFVETDPLSVAELAERMGRSASSIHYHVRLLVGADLLVEADSRRVGRRTEKLYRPVAERLVVARDAEKEDGGNPALETVRSAFRMAERDVQAALSDPGVQSEGSSRTLFATRAHLRIGPSRLEELNEHLARLEELIAETRNHEPSEDDFFLSLTLALAPLPDRRISR